MKLDKKLIEWQQHDLIDEATADKISTYEKHHSKPILLWALGGLGTFTIIVGLISVIAANWAAVTDELKLAIDLLVAVTLAVALYRAATNKNKNLWLIELLVILYYGFTLASMALIGQTYQLGGSIASLLLMWSIATLPLVLVGRGHYLAYLWLVSTSVSYVLNIEAAHDLMQLWFHSTLSNAIFISLYTLTPYVFILLSRLPWLQVHRPVFSAEISKYSWVVIILFGWFTQFMWYERIFGLSLELVNICLVATVLLMFFIPKLYREEAASMHLVMRVVLAAVFVLGASAIMFNQQLEWVGALSNVAYLCVLAWAALKIKSVRLFNVLTALICLRILIIYFEVFGSMLETGLGLIVGGLLTLMIAWWWFKKSATLAQRWGEA